MTTTIDALLGQIQDRIDPVLFSILKDLAAGNADRNQVVKTLTATALTGALTGSLTGTHTGNAALAATVLTPVELTASGAIPATASFVELNKSGGAIAATLTLPTAGRLLVITQTDAGTAGHTLTLGAGTFDGTNDTATFNAAGETLVLLGISATRFAILLNLGEVGLSNP